MMEDSEIRAALDRHWAASDTNDFEAEHQIYRENTVLDYPQSGERKVAHETQYFSDPFEPGPSRAEWVERIR